MIISSEPTGKKSVNSYANDEMSPPICGNTRAGNKQTVQQDYAALDPSEPSNARYRWRKLKMNYSEEILRMYPYLAEPDSDGDDDIEEGEEDEYVRWDPVQKVHVKRETPLREIAKRNIDIIPTAETERFLPEDMVTVEILLKMVSEADDFSLNSTAPEISPTRASTPPDTSISESLPLPNAHLDSEHDRPLEAYDDLPTTRQQDELFIEPLGHQNNNKNINLLPECVLQDLQQKTEETRVKSDFKESCTTSNCPGLPKTLSGETSCLQNESNSYSLVTEDMEAMNEDEKSAEELEKIFAEPSRYFVAGIKNRLLQNFHFNECNPEHRFHGFRGCKSSRRATIIYRRTYKRPMSRVTYQLKPLRKQWGARLDNDQTIPVCEAIDKNRPEIGDYYSCEFTPSTKKEATDLGNKNLWGVLEVDNNAKLTHSIDNHGASLGMLDLINCGYMPFEKSLSVTVGGYFGFSALISEHIPDYDRELVDRCLSVTKKRSGPVSVTDTLPDMARDLAYQKGEAAGRQQMLEVAMKLANEIVKQKLCNAFSEKSEFLDTDLMIKRSLQQAALGSYEDHTQHEEAPNHARAIREHHSTHTELEEVKNQHGKEPIDWSNKKTNEFRRSCGISVHSLKEYPSSLKNSGEKRKHHEEFEEVKGSSRKHRRRRSASKENDSRRYRQQDKSRSRSGPSQDSGRRYDEKHSPSKPRKDTHRRHDDSDIPDRSYNDSRCRQDRSHSASKPRGSDRRINEKNSPSKSHKGSRRRNDDIDSPGKSHKDPCHCQHDEVKSPSTNYKGSRRKKSERETEKSHTKTQDRSPNRGRHRDHDCESSEYHAAEKIIGDIVRRKRKYSTPSPSPLPPSLVKVKPQKEIRKSIFATPNEVNEQKRSEEASGSRRSSQKHHQSTPISNTIRDINVKKVSPIAGTIATKEKSATPKVIPTNLTDEKEATSKDSQASQTDVRPTPKAGRSLAKEGTDKEGCEVEVRQSLGNGKRMKKAFSNVESPQTEPYQTLKVTASMIMIEAYQTLQDGPSITKKTAGKEASPQIEVQQTSKIQNCVDSTSKEEPLRTNVNLNTQVEQDTAKKGLQILPPPPPVGPRFKGFYHSQNNGPRDYQSQKIHHPHEYHSHSHQPQGHYPQDHYAQDHYTQDYLPQARTPQGYHPQGHLSQGHPSQGYHSHSYSSHSYNSHDYHTQDHQSQVNKFQGHTDQGNQHQSHHGNFSLVLEGNSTNPRNGRGGGYRGSKSTPGERQRY